MLFSSHISGGSTGIIFQKLQKENSDNIDDFIKKVISQKRSIKQILSFQLSSEKWMSHLILRNIKHDFIAEFFVLMIAEVVVIADACESVFLKECD